MIHELDRDAPICPRCRRRPRQYRGMNRWRWRKYRMLCARCQRDLRVAAGYQDLPAPICRECWERLRALKEYRRGRPCWRRTCWFCDRAARVARGLPADRGARGRNSLHATHSAPSTSAYRPKNSSANAVWRVLPLAGSRSFRPDRPGSKADGRFQGDRRATTHSRSNRAPVAPHCTPDLYATPEGGHLRDRHIRAKTHSKEAGSRLLSVGSRTIVGGQFAQNRPQTQAQGRSRADRRLKRCPPGRRHLALRRYSTQSSRTRPSRSRHPCEILR